jgi:transcriptional accessory protein Tex/SPT6
MVTGRVTKLVTFGAFARIDGPVEGLVHVSELVDRRINHPREVVTEGDILPLRIVRIERDRHRLGLSLRAARDEAERLGWEFNTDGSVAYVPDEVRQEVEARTGGPSPAEAAVPEGRQPAEPDGFADTAMAQAFRNGNIDEAQEPASTPANPGQNAEQ